MFEKIILQYIVIIPRVIFLVVLLKEIIVRKNIFYIETIIWLTPLIFIKPYILLNLKYIKKQLIVYLENNIHYVNTAYDYDLKEFQFKELIGINIDYNYINDKYYSYNNRGQFQRV